MEILTWFGRVDLQTGSLLTGPMLGAEEADGMIKPQQSRRSQPVPFLFPSPICAPWPKPAALQPTTENITGCCERRP